MAMDNRAALLRLVRGFESLWERHFTQYPVRGAAVSILATDDLGLMLRDPGSATSQSADWLPMALEREADSGKAVGYSACVMMANVKPPP